VVCQLEKHRRLRFEPGAKAAYSNLGYLVLGEVIESASGKLYEQCVHENLLAPLGMQHTGFTIRADTAWATPYQRRHTGLNTRLPFMVPREIIGKNAGRFRSFNHFYLHEAPYGGLVGPAVDVARFVGAYLGDGEWNGTRILSSESARSTRKIVAHGRKGQVGLGWYRRGKNLDPDFVEHLGGGAGRLIATLSVRRSVEPPLGPGAPTDQFSCFAVLVAPVLAA
jgi:CubicO group peptidase (beta-lactamase class C family)